MGRAGYHGGCVSVTSCDVTGLNRKCLGAVRWHTEELGIVEAILSPVLWGLSSVRASTECG